MKTHYILPLIFFALFSIGLKAQTVPAFTRYTLDISLDEVYDVFPADLDADGDQDIIAVSRTDGAAWYENDGGVNPSFTKIVLDDTTNSQRSVFVVDLDDDDDLDIIIATQIDGFSDGSNIFWYENDGATDPSFTRQTLGLVKGFAYDFDVADIDGDSDLDLAVTDNSGRSSGFSAEDVTWFENDGATDPSFTKRQIDIEFRFAETIKIGDIDGDGDLDIVVGSDYLDDIVWYENNGAANPTFSSNYADQNALGVDGIDLADIDNDGHLDIVFADTNSDYIAWLQNNGAANPTFSEVRIESYNAISLVEVADIDLDGDLDILSGSVIEDDIFWYENDGLASPGFTKHTIASSLDQPESIHIADINGNGSPDFVAGIFRANDVLWFQSDKITIKQGSIELDGIDDQLSIGHNDVFNDLNALTIEAWVYVNSGGRNGIIEKHDSPSSGWWIDFNTDISAVLVTASGDVINNSTVNPELGTWNHLAVSYDGTDIKIYLNGTDISGSGSGSGNGTILNNSNPINIGYFNWESSYLDGKIDEVRIWNTVISESKIRENMYQKLSGSEDGLIGYWTFDEKTTSIALDLTSSNNTASLNNGAKRSKISHPYGTVITGNEGWRMMTSPVSEVSYGELLDTLWTQGFTGADASNGTSNIYTWDESTQAFSSISNANDVPAAGTGFLTYVYNDDDFDGTGDGFPKVIKTDSTQRSGTVTPTLSYTNSDTLANDGWNLVGNPYGATIDWDAASGLSSSNLDASFYVWSDSASGGSGAYLSWNGTTGTYGNGKIAPWQGFWVKANAAAPTLSLTDETRSAGGVLRKEAPVPQLGFTLEGETLSSKTMLMFSDNASTEKDVLDAYKLQSLNTEYLSLFTQLENGSGLDINALPSSLEESISIPLDFVSSTGSENSEPSAPTGFELNWNLENLPDGMTMVLVDNQTGTQINLTEASSYSFELDSKTKSASPPAEGTEGWVPPHGVLSTPKPIKAKAGSTARFTIIINGGTSVSNEPTDELPSVVELQQNYPNPFNPSTTIAFGLPQSGKVTLEVFDILGRKVATLLNGQQRTAGQHTISFDASSFSSGMYIYRLQAGNSVITKKLTLIK